MQEVSLKAYSIVIKTKSLYNLSPRVYGMVHQVFYWTFVAINLTTKSLYKLGSKLSPRVYGIVHKVFYQTSVEINLFTKRGLSPQRVYLYNLGSNLSPRVYGMVHKVFYQTFVEINLSTKKGLSPQREVYVYHYITGKLK